MYGITTLAHSRQSSSNSERQTLDKFFIHLAWVRPWICRSHNGKDGWEIGLHSLVSKASNFGKSCNFSKITYIMISTSRKLQAIFPWGLGVPAWGLTLQVGGRGKEICPCKFGHSNRDISKG